MIPLIFLLITVSALKPPAVVVLGSGGLIGRDLVVELKEQGETVVELRNRRHVDLRDHKAFLDFIETVERDFSISFVYFLACEVGGSKYLYGDDQTSIITSNVRMYQTLFPWLSSRQIPFLFTSSSLQSQNDPYGVIKRLGENWIESIGIGKSIRLWNIYGVEPHGVRSRVITDWIKGCIDNGEIHSLTDGTEKRQFMYSKDCAKALVIMMRQYEQMDQVTDLSSFQWTLLSDLASIVASRSTRKCVPHFTAKKASVIEPPTPSRESSFYSFGWKPYYSIEKAIEELYLIYSDTQCTEENKFSLSQTI